MNKVQGINIKRILFKLRREGYGTKDGGLRHRGVLVMEVRAGDLIVSILKGKTNEETIPRHSFTREPEVERSNNFDGRVLGDYNQFGHVPILDFEYDEDRSTVS